MAIDEKKGDGSVSHLVSGHGAFTCSTSLIVPTTTEPQSDTVAMCNCVAVLFSSKKACIKKTNPYYGIHFIFSLLYSMICIIIIYLNLVVLKLLNIFLNFMCFFLPLFFPLHFRSSLRWTFAFFFLRWSVLYYSSLLFPLFLCFCIQWIRQEH